MTILVILLAALLAWLLYETKWFTIRLPGEPFTFKLAGEAAIRPQRNQMIEAAAYLLVITAVEVVTIFYHPLWGIIGHTALLATVIVHSAQISDRTRRQMVLSLALVPLIRVMDLSLPLLDIDPMWRFTMVYAPLLVASVVVVRVLGYSRNEVGFKLKSLPIQLGVALTGLLLGGAEYLILRPEQALIAQFTWSEALPISLVLVVSTGFVEEFAFRGVLQRSAVELFGWWGIVYVSLIFSALHMGFRSWEDVIFVFGVAMFFGWAVKKTGSLFGVTIAHGITNILLFVVLPFIF